MGGRTYFRLALASIGVMLSVAAITLGATAGVLAFVSIFRAAEKHIQWGSVAEWSGAIGTVAAFAAGVVVIRRDNRLRRTEDADRRKIARRAQASAVTAWFDPDSYEFELLNSSRGMIYPVAICAWFKPPNKPEEDGNFDAVSMAAVPPGTRRLPIHIRPERVAGSTLRFNVYFTDETGTHWDRDAWGRLDESPLSPEEQLARIAETLHTLGEQLELRRDRIIKDAEEMLKKYPGMSGDGVAR
jgi:hypothetical protein